MTQYTTRRKTDKDGSMDEDRLGRIESKLDKLSEAIVSLARVEERITTLFSRQDANELMQQNNTKRIAELEQQLASSKNTIRLGERAFWIVFAAAVSMGVWAYRSGLT